MNLCNSKTIHQHHNSLFVKTHKQLKDKHIGYIHLENGPYCKHSLRTCEFYTVLRKSCIKIFNACFYDLRFLIDLQKCLSLYINCIIFKMSKQMLPCKYLLYLFGQNWP